MLCGWRAAHSDDIRRTGSSTMSTKGKKHIVEMRLHMGRGGGWDNGIGNVCCLNGVEGEGRELIVLNPLRVAIITLILQHTHLPVRCFDPFPHTNLDYMMAI